MATFYGGDQLNEIKTISVTRNGNATNEVIYTMPSGFYGFVRGRGSNTSWSSLTANVYDTSLGGVIDAQANSTSALQNIGHPYSGNNSGVFMNENDQLRITYSVFSSSTTEFIVFIYKKP